MKVSINWANYHAQLGGIDLKSIPTAVMLQKIGAQLGAVEEVVHWGPRFDGIVVAKIVTCDKHPNADKLNICMVDDGGIIKGVARSADGLVQVVCGAPNARAGIYVAWLPPGVTVPSTISDKEPFVLSSKEIRGVVSNGMLASLKELGIGDDHSGILEVVQDGPNEIVPGTPFKELYDLDDVVIDCENKMFTHRPDCFGILGVARELAGINGLKFKSPDWYLNVVALEPKINLKISSHNEISNVVPRFMLQVVEGVSVASGPLWMQAGLTRVGIRPVSNVVDISNYFMQLTAQPTHAFDYDKVKALSGNDTVEIFPRMARAGETLKLLSGKTIKLDPQDIVICASDKPIALAGIMGGSETEVDQNTKNIVIESATFDMYTVRRSSMRHGLFTDAVTRYNKGQSPLQNDRVLARLVTDMVSHAGGTAGQLYDSNPNPLSESQHPVEISAAFINRRLGSELTGAEVVSLLANVEVPAEIINDNKIVVSPPFWRMDLQLKEDIVEELGRLYGYDNLPAALPPRLSSPAPKDPMLTYKHSLRSALSKAGANEVLTYSFVHGDLMKKSGIDTSDNWAFHIRNALSPDLQYYRTSLLTSLLAKVHMNLKSDRVRSDDNEFAIFEVGKAHVKNHLDNEGLPSEFERLALVFAADNKTYKNKYEGDVFYQAKHFLLPLLPPGAQVAYAPLETNEFPLTSAYQQGRSAIIIVDGELLGVIGEFRASVTKAFKLPTACAGFEIDISLLMKHQQRAAYTQMSEYPKSQQDITLEVPYDTYCSAVTTLLTSELTRITEAEQYNSTLQLRDIFAPDGAEKKSFTFRIWLSHPTRTLKTEEVTAVIDHLSTTVSEIFSPNKAQ